MDGIKYALFTGINMNELKKKMISEVCEGCVKGKMTRHAKTGQKEWHANELLDVWVSDVMGPMPVHAIGGYRYVLLTSLVVCSSLCSKARTKQQMHSSLSSHSNRHRQDVNSNSCTQMVEERA